MRVDYVRVVECNRTRDPPSPLNLLANTPLIISVGCLLEMRAAELFCQLLTQRVPNALLCVRGNRAS
jgi:hypothetical protein